MDFTISLDFYEGRIDSLHSLIKRNEIEITDVPLAQIVGEYLQWLKTALIDLDSVGDFLAIASHLLLIKVRALLPARSAEIQDESEDEALQSGEVVFRMIQQYRKFRELAEELAAREKGVLQRYPRPSSLLDFQDENGEEVPISELLRAFSKVMEKATTPSGYQVHLDEVDLEAKVAEILQILASKGKVLFEKLFSNQTHRIEIIVTFMAILELVKMRKALVKQKKIFDRIWVYERKQS